MLQVSACVNLPVEAISGIGQIAVLFTAIAFQPGLSVQPSKLEQSTAMRDIGVYKQPP